ncbi:hypothetical protein C8F04DRAFT_1264698 [Mycena alexandri]|uniref:CxC2-like cysteine cluster KDZ transposase-associated domain-containing protein n=1 Tax=Mycena alexandri TaxID=1745969 RepID=A0AAD6WW57_9AGAR|nr:hypothetical protein C8F04DRAFT_1264698 [Mycena alexandri]
MDPAFQDMDFIDILKLEEEGNGRLKMPENRPTRCERCNVETNGLYRCRTCFWPRFNCRACTLAAHAEHPLHRIESWPGFQGTSLAQLGLVVYLGHGGDKCPKGVTDADFTIVGLDGAHDVTLNFCACEKAPARQEMQLESMRLHGWRNQHTALDFEIARYREDLGLISRKQETKRRRKVPQVVQSA